MITGRCAIGSDQCDGFFPEIGRFAPVRVLGLGFEFDGANLVIPRSALPGLDVAEASTDYPDIGLGLLQAFQNHYDALSGPDQPQTWRTWKNEYLMYRSSEFGLSTRIFFVVKFILNKTTPTIADEV